MDTNVLVTANSAVNPSAIPSELDECVDACCQAVDHIVKKGGLVIDSWDEIVTEYANNVRNIGPGIGGKFIKWIYDNQWNEKLVTRVEITKSSDLYNYNEFPTNAELKKFDASDRKFIAVANARPEKPPILQATDSQWWGYKDVLKEIGITVLFLCPGYVQSKYQEKFDEPHDN